MIEDLKVNNENEGSIFLSLHGVNMDIAKETLQMMCMMECL